MNQGHHYFPLGTDHYFFIGGGGYHFWDLQTIFFLSNAFHTIFFITFFSENNFFTTILKKRYRLFYGSYLKKKTLLAHAYT